MEAPIDGSEEKFVPQYLGFDFSTQQVKAIVINDELEVLCQAFVHFDNHLPEYRTHGGVNKNEDGMTVTAPTIMFVKALDMLMDKLRVAGADFTKICAISGTAQQHGCAYWRRGAKEVLGGLDPSRFMYEQLTGWFSVYDAPIWMDSSTTQQCKDLENAVGGPQKLANITGSRAYERFSANQINKIYKLRPEAYENTERISLLSSMACSLFLGDFAPIDLSDGSGMNLLDINTKDWSTECLEACAPDLENRLGSPCSSSTMLGNIASYFQERYGFKSDCKVVAFTGDNPASIAGLGLKEGDVAVSLGTSDTVFTWQKEAAPQLDGNVFINPIDSDAFMSLLCYKNGSLTRERVRNNMADSNWKIFSELLDNTPRGNFGNIGMYFDEWEIAPKAVGDHRFNKLDEKVTRYTSNEAEVRALVEGQFLAKRVHVENLGYTIGSNQRVLATGGASSNLAILQVMADVFNAPVYVQDVVNSACLGSCYRAKHAMVGGKFHEVIQGQEPRQAVTPNRDAFKIYSAMAERYRKLEKEVLRNQCQQI